MHLHQPLLDGLLERRRGPLGDDYAGYKNHRYRVSNFCLAFCDERPESMSKVSIAATFHGLGI